MVIQYPHKIHEPCFEVQVRVFNGQKWKYLPGTSIIKFGLYNKRQESTACFFFCEESLFCVSVKQRVTHNITLSFHGLVVFYFQSPCCIKLGTCCTIAHRTNSGWCRVILKTRWQQIQQVVLDCQSTARQQGTVCYLLRERHQGISFNIQSN